MASGGDGSGITLYHVVPSRSCRVLWTINELGLAANIVEKNFLEDKSVIKTDEFLKINPTGKLPALTDSEGVCVNESPAALLYLLDRYADGKLQPPAGDWAGRAKMLQWVIFAESEITVNLARYFWHSLGKLGDEAIPAIGEDGKKRALSALDTLEKELQGKEYLVNNTFSAADISTGYSVKFLGMLQLELERFPNIMAYLDRLSTRDAFKKTFGS